MTNPHMIPYATDPGWIQLEVSGMAAEALTEQMLDGVRELLSRHELDDKLRVYSENDPYGTTLWYIAEPGARSADDAVMCLNLDDQSFWSLNETLTPPLFVFELVKLLSTAVNPYTGTALDLDYMMSMARAGQAVMFDSHPTWADYEALVRL